MDETYRMLGREHEADLEREAAARRRATAMGRRRESATVRRRRKRVGMVVARVAALVGR